MAFLPWQSCLEQTFSMCKPSVNVLVSESDFQIHVTDDGWTSEPAVIEFEKSAKICWDFIDVLSSWFSLTLLFIYYTNRCYHIAAARDNVSLPITENLFFRLCKTNGCLATSLLGCCQCGYIDDNNEPLLIWYHLFLNFLFSTTAIKKAVGVLNRIFLSRSILSQMSIVILVTER